MNKKKIEIIFILYNSLYYTERTSDRQLITINMVSIQAFFKGTPIHYHLFDTTEKVFEFLDKVSPEGVLTADEVYQQMEDWEQTLNEECVNGYINKYVIKRVAERFEYPTIGTFVVSWFANVRFLLKTGRIQDDDNFGFLIIDGGDETKNRAIIKSLNKDLKQEYQICGVCSQPAKLLCSKCKKIYYCCKEHQVANWKDHKPFC